MNRAIRSPRRRSGPHNHMTRRILPRGQCPACDRLRTLLGQERNAYALAVTGLVANA